MIARSLLALIFIVSCAHALVHVYEIALPSVEQQIAHEFYSQDPAAGKRLSGLLSNSWRLMWGIGAIVAGWCVDRFGSRRLLLIYLIGCSLACGLAATSTTEDRLFLSMMVMGALASIYHPAGLALISHETTAINRPRALGWHGIFGSAGIGVTPLIAGVLLNFGWTWRNIYFALMVPGILVALLIAFETVKRRSRPTPATPSTSLEDDRAHWGAFFVLTLLAAAQGFVYSAVMSFLPRYLSRDIAENLEVPPVAYGNYLAAGVLFMGCFGQAIAGRWARSDRLEKQLTLVTMGNIPMLAWMSVATGVGRPVAAGLFALVHFMHQPLYNSLVAKYSSKSRRSLCYGFSFAMGLGLGSFGAGFAGILQGDFEVYGALALIAIGGAGIGALLWRMNALAASDVSTHDNRM